MGTPARRPAAVVPAPPWCTTARQAGKPAAKSIAPTTLTCSKWGTWPKSVPAEQTNARSPNCAQAVLIMATVSAGDSIGMLPKPKKIGGVPAAIHDATSSSASVGNSIASAPTNGPSTIPFRPFGSQPGKANLVVGLDFQPSAFGDPSRQGAVWPSAGRVHGAARPRPSSPCAKTATRTPSLRSGTTAPAGMAGPGRWPAPGRYAAWPTECRSTPRRWRRAARNSVR